VCICAVGRTLADAVAAAGKLAAEGVEATVWDVRCCSPLDADMIADAARHGRVVTVEDGIAAGGIGAAIADALRTTDGATPEIRVLGLPTQFLTHGSPDDILARHGLDAAGIAAAAGA